ncbi:hypothetical protein V5H41_29920, partial [Salmonella enterica]
IEAQISTIILDNARPAALLAPSAGKRPLRRLTNKIEAQISTIILDNARPAALLAPSAGKRPLRRLTN